MVNKAQWQLTMKPQLGWKRLLAVTSQHSLTTSAYLRVQMGRYYPARANPQFLQLNGKKIVIKHFSHFGFILELFYEQKQLDYAEFRPLKRTLMIGGKQKWRTHIFSRQQWGKDLKRNDASLQLVLSAGNQCCDVSSKQITYVSWCKVCIQQQISTFYLFIIFILIFQMRP